MRIAVLGAGAVGGHLAARLGLSGQRVGVVARGRHLDAMCENGLTLLTDAGENTVQVEAYASAQPLGRQDIVFVAVKANSLQGVIDELKYLVGDETIVVFAQNGIPWWYPLSLSAGSPLPDLSHFRLARPILDLVPQHSIVGGIVHASSEVALPGRVVNNSPRNGLVVGYVDDRSDARIDALRAALEAAGFRSPAPASIRKAVWLKLLRNMSSSSLSAATDSSTAMVRADPALAEVFVRIVEETMAVADAAGFSLDADPRRMLDETSDVIPSLLQDIRLGRPVEIEELLMAPLHFARALGVATPTTDAVVAIAAQIARRRGLLA